MKYLEVQFDALRPAHFSQEWATIFKRIDADEYSMVYLSESQAKIVEKELLHDNSDLPDACAQFLADNVKEGYSLDSLMIDEPDGILQATLVFKEGDNTLKTECPAPIAIALAVRTKARIFVEESCFCVTISDPFVLDLLTS